VIKWEKLYRISLPFQRNQWNKHTTFDKCHSHYKYLVFQVPTNKLATIRVVDILGNTCHNQAFRKSSWVGSGGVQGIIPKGSIIAYRSCWALNSNFFSSNVIFDNFPGHRNSFYFFRRPGNQLKFVINFFDSIEHVARIMSRWNNVSLASEIMIA